MPANAAAAVRSVLLAAGLAVLAQARGPEPFAIQPGANDPLPEEEL
jgi:hypothetical protein